MRRLALALPWLFVVFVVATIVWDQTADREVLALAPLDGEVSSEPVDPDPDGVAEDPVCGMTIRKATAYRVTLDGRHHHFCSTYCRDEAVADPAKWLGVDAPKRSPDEGHVMRGLPAWMFQVGIVLVMLVSFGLFELISWRNPGGGDALGGRLSLTPAGTWAGRLIKRPWTRFSVQLLMALMFLVIIVTGLFGNQNPTLNLAPMLTWTIWWAGLIGFVLFFGKLWCSVCPWDGLATWVEGLKFWGPRRDRAIGLDLRWPRSLRNIWPAVALFFLLTWLELGLGVVGLPRVTAYMALGMFGLALASVLFYDRKVFCRYGCPVGMISGLYAQMGSTELRVVEPAACKGCRTKDCYRGNEAGEGCPVFEFPGVMDRSTYCTMCTDCIKTCPEDNIAIRIRPWGVDLANNPRVRTDEAGLAIVLLCLTAFHGLTMTPRWPLWKEALRDAVAIPELLSFTILMVLVVVLPAAVFIALSWATARIGRVRSARKVVLRYSYALLPIALFYHLAHNAEHFFMEGPKVLALASDPLGWGWNLFGTSEWVLPPLITLEGLWILQVVFIMVGHLYGLWITEKTTRRLVPDRKRAFFAQLPMLAAMILSSVISLWLLSQPMQMRVAAM